MRASAPSSTKRPARATTRKASAGRRSTPSLRLSSRPRLGRGRCPSRTGADRPCQPCGTQPAYAGSMEPLAKASRAVVLDTETTGLSAAARIVEFAALEVHPRTGAMGGRLHAIIDPEMPIPAVVTRIHGIRDCDVVGRPTFRALADEICAFISGATVIAQNASFDKRMLELELARAGRPTIATLGVSLVDTLAAARGLFPLLPRHSLDGICDHVGVDRAARQRHGALLDAELVAQALPGMARAYDAWLSASDDDARVP